MVSSLSFVVVVAVAAVTSAVPTGHMCACPLIYSPVCASNGKVYSNACMARCNNLEIVHDGRCGKLDFFGDNQIEVASDEDFCPCTKEFNPVCGSDHQTYDNKCLLRCAAKKNKSLEILHDGGCDLPQINNFKLDWPLVTEIPETGDDDMPDFQMMVEKESVPCICTMEYMPVCGSNLHTYPNKCMLECDMKKDKTLKMLYPSLCVIMP